MKEALRSQNGQELKVNCGVFTKEEAARLIGGGAPHIHASEMKEKDPCLRSTGEILAGRKIKYPWETSGGVEAALKSSADRSSAIRKMTIECGLTSRRELKEKLESIAEELLSNAFYHAYRQLDGTPKYRRKETVVLSGNEVIFFRYACHNEGIFLSVQDRGGELCFEHISKSFNRCYGNQKTQIESKESGAGLGLYMVFEMVTHIRIDVKRNEKTCVSCWVPERRASDLTQFSFNYFEEY